MQTAAKILVACLIAAPLWAANPIFTHKYTADPNPIVWNDRLYVYASQDDNNPPESGYNITAYTLISTDDMVNWTDHGEVFQVKRDMAWANQAYAPGAAVRNNKVYLYVPDGGASIGVVYANSPEGPWTDPNKKTLISKSMPNCNVPWLFDPAAFVDDDGQAYLFFGGGDGESAGTNLRGIKLNDDMISVSGSAVTIDSPCSFEAAYMHKHNGTYYFSYSTNFATCTPKGGNAWIDYLTSDSPLGTFTRKGSIVPNGAIVGYGNNHAGTVLFKDKWYVFYHDRRARAANGVSAGEFRSVSVDVFTHNNANSTINQATLTADGPPQIKNFNPYNTIRATTMNGQSGIKTTTTNATEGTILSSISAGDYIRLKGVDFGTAGAASVSVRAASAAGGGSIELRTGSATGTLIGTVNIASTGSWDTWQTFTASITNATGVKDYLYLVFRGSGEPFRLSWYQFQGSGGTSSSSSAILSSSSAATVTVTCNVNNLNANYPAGSEIPRPNITCSSGTPGTASFVVNGNDATGWNSPGGTHAFWNDGTRNVTLNSVACGSTTVGNLSLNCGSFTVAPIPSSSSVAISSSSSARNQSSSSTTTTAIVGIPSLTNSTVLVEIYDLKGNKVDMQSPLPSGVYIAKMRGKQSKMFVVK